MSSVMRSFRLIVHSGPVLRECNKPAAATRAGLRGLERAGPPLQYSFFGSCMLRTRLKWRFTAAAFLRLRSAVGFS